MFVIMLFFRLNKYPTEQQCQHEYSMLKTHYIEAQRRSTSSLELPGRADAIDTRIMEQIQPFVLQSWSPRRVR